MRLAVLDIGSNSAHLRVVDAYPGSPPLPVFRYRAPIRLAEAVHRDGTVSDEGVRRLVDAVAAALDSARRQHVAELIPFATSALRDAANRAEILDRLRAETGISVSFLSGEDEGRLTYFAAHRWLGWSAAPLLLLDIGGGSLEIAHGRDEDPALVASLPLGAGRLTGSHLPDHPASRQQVKALRRHVRDTVRPTVERLWWEARPRAVATSRTFKQLARLTGSRRAVRTRDLKPLITRLSAMSVRERAALPGVPRARARQILAGAVVAHTVLDHLDLPRVEICPWALREGILLRRLSPLLTADSLYQVELIHAAAGYASRRRASAGTGDR
jgi:exopolyphosphatase / guanosine-5'-triphosphate,3'-diphosphate pyrophosphatase